MFCALLLSIVIGVYFYFRKKAQSLVFSSIQNMDIPSDENLNLKAFLMVIRFAEGTYGANGYNLIYGGSTFMNYADHPRIVKCYQTAKGRLCSSAAGAYQFLSTTWDDINRKLHLPDFSPASQDKACIQLLSDIGALEYVLSGDFETAIQKCNKTWASLPGSPYGQPTKSLAQLEAVYKSNNGQLIA